jgi:LPXTG-site transpeptidase (sortase) family protein
MFLGAKLSTTNYDALLIGWEGQPHITNVDFHGGNSTYCAGESARANMTGPDNWEIDDSGLNCDTPFTVIIGANTFPANWAVLTSGPTQIKVEFNQDAKSGGGAQGADYTGNYLLVEAGANGFFNTQSCAVPGGGNATVDDSKVTINSAAYDGSDPFIVTLGINGGVPLPVGRYRLFICGTATIQNTADAELNEGVFDSILSFTVRALPDTGYSPGRVTVLPQQPMENAYTSSGLQIEIPSLGVEAGIVGVPNDWDVRWLGSSVGWLPGTAFPTWAGNTALTAHVYGPDGLPGPFVDLGRLGWGDEVVIHAWGQRYVYEVRQNYLARPSSLTPLQHEEYDWVTLLTCERYDEALGGYAFRRVVRAVLIDAAPEWWSGFPH